MTDLEKRIAIYALNYSLGRMTGAPSDVQQYILSNVRYFKAWEIRAMIRDIDESPRLGMKSDVIQWQDFKNKLQKAIDEM